MKTMKKVFGFAWLGWAKVTLGFSRLGYSMFQAGVVANHSADKRAKSLGAGR